MGIEGSLLNNFNSSMYFRLLAFIPCAFVASTLHHMDRKSRMYNWSCLLHPECLWYISIQSHRRHTPYVNKRALKLKNDLILSSGNLAGYKQDIIKELQCHVPLSYQSYHHRRFQRLMEEEQIGLCFIIVQVINGLSKRSRIVFTFTHRELSFSIKCHLGIISWAIVVP